MDRRDSERLKELNDLDADGVRLSAGEYAELNSLLAVENHDHASSHPAGCAECAYGKVLGCWRCQS